jgi:hypothetical protein
VAPDTITNGELTHHPFKVQGGKCGVRLESNTCGEKQGGQQTKGNRLKEISQSDGTHNFSTIYHRIDGGTCASASHDDLTPGGIAV